MITNKIRTIFAVCACAVFFGCAAVPSASAQAKKPTIMVVPDDAWCTANGYMLETDEQGKKTRTPDYERALQENIDLVTTITKIGELMNERGFPLKDLSSAIKSINRNSAEDEMLTSSTSGATLAESAYDRIISRAKADIIIEVLWRVNTIGPKRSITYQLKGVDAYSTKNVASAEGTSPSSFSAEIPVLIEEAVLEKMDGFTSQLQAHFDDMLQNGREVVLNVRVFDNGSGLSLEDEYDGEELADIIDSWMAQNTVEHRFNLSDQTENLMRFEQVRIPLYRPNGTAMDTRHFANSLRKFLSGSPYNLTSKVITKGLGRADIILGEK